MKYFTEFNLPNELSQALNNQNYSKATPIQAEAIPIALAGSDILATSQTGTGKTIAFAVPLINKLLKSPESKALVIAPTREIATQVMDVIKKLVLKGSNIKSALLIGGNPIMEQLKQMSYSPRIIVGTPGRINDHLQRNEENFTGIDFLILDETDRMLDMGFEIQIKQILSSIKKTRQTLMFSATLPDEILKLSKKYLNNPVRVAMASMHLPDGQIKQETISVSSKDKYSQFLSQIEQREGSIIVFIKTKSDADKMAARLRENNHTADAMHGDLRQRQRDRVIRFFKNKKNRIMVATDVAARGLDIPHIEHVINYDLPHCAEDYVHRIGRTARAGANGSALNLVSPDDDRKWKQICKLMGIKYEIHPENMQSLNNRSRNRPARGENDRFKSKARTNSNSWNKFGERKNSSDFIFNNSDKFKKNVRKNFGQDEERTASPNKRFFERKKDFSNDSREFSRGPKDFSKGSRDTNKSGFNNERSERNSNRPPRNKFRTDSKIKVYSDAFDRNIGRPNRRNKKAS